MIRIHRNYDPVTLVRGTEAVSVHVGRLVVDVRWRSAEDGTTPYWNLTSRWRGPLGWKTLCDWTFYDGDER